uniref:Uncharacterized protein n=1 Tax=Anguilla anguilla TaxID=7936 RepID=A0A0E9U8U0_ANGAN
MFLQDHAGSILSVSTLIGWLILIILWSTFMNKHLYLHIVVKNGDLVFRIDPETYFWSKTVRQRQHDEERFLNCSFTADFDLK